MINLTLFCDQAADSHQTGQKSAINQSKHRKLNEQRRPEKRRSDSLNESNDTEKLSRNCYENQRERAYVR